jgi:hypothetical protein
LMQYVKWRQVKYSALGRELGLGHSGRLHSKLV